MTKSTTDILILKSQEAGGGFARSVAETIAADLGYQGGAQNQRALAATIETALNNFTASMRNACIEKVKAFRDAWLKRLPNSDDPSFKSHYQTRANAAEEIITALESVSIQERKS